MNDGEDRREEGRVVGERRRRERGGRERGSRARFAKDYRHDEKRRMWKKGRRRRGSMGPRQVPSQGGHGDDDDELSRGGCEWLTSEWGGRCGT